MGDDEIECPKCDGTGVRTITHRGMAGSVTCDHCHGDGTIDPARRGA